MAIRRGICCKSICNDAARTWPVIHYYLLSPDFAQPGRNCASKDIRGTSSGEAKYPADGFSGVVLCQNRERYDRKPNPRCEKTRAT